MKKLFIMTNTQKVLEFLCQHPAEQFLASEVQKATKISKGGVSVSLRELVHQKMVVRAAKGNSFLYSVEHKEPVIRQFKVLKNVAAIEPLIARLKPLTTKIILFGSSARGEDSFESDIDLCVVAQAPQAVEEQIRKAKIKRKLQTIIRTPVQFFEMEKKDPVFWKEIAKGITVWEEKQ